MKLRQHQSEVLDQIDECFDRGLKRIILQAPTGSGKTVMASSYVKTATENGKKVLFLAHRRELIMQCSDKLNRFGIPHGIIMAKEMPKKWHDVQVASIDTLRARAMNSKKIPLPEADILIIDECHRSLSKTYRNLIDLYPKALIIGLTATPCRGDGRGLGHIYEDMVQAPSVKVLTADGYLIGAKYFAPTKPDLEGVKTQMGDYVASQLAARMDQVALVGDVVTHWLRIAGGKRTVVFASSVAHSRHLRDRFEEAGVRAEHLDGETSVQDRDEILRKLEDGEIDVLCNCLVLTEGWDCPSAAVCVLARPTKSLGLYFQMVGRVLRPKKGKGEAIIIDHAGAVYEHGFVDDEVIWDLSPLKKIQVARNKKKGIEKEPITCAGCFTVYSKQKACPECGAVPIRKGRAMLVGEGTLQEVSNGKVVQIYTPNEKERWYQMMLKYARLKKYKDGWAWYKYQEKFAGEMPRFKKVCADFYTPEFNSWITHVQIKQAAIMRAKLKSGLT